MIVERPCSSPDALARTLAAEIAQRLSDGVAARGAAGFVAAGGSTPGPVYDELSQTAAPWGRVAVTPSDERWVSPDDPASNERLLRRRLLRNLAAAARLTPLKTPAPMAAEAVADVDEALRALPRPFDVMLLGMGADGHVASLFPHAPELAVALDDEAPLVCAVRSEDAAGAAERLSLTRRALLDSRAIIVLFEGPEKLAVYRRALEGEDIEAMPIRMVLQQRRVPVQVWWAP